MAVAHLFQQLRRCILLPDDTDVQTLRKTIYPSFLVASCFFTGLTALLEEAGSVLFYLGILACSWSGSLLAFVLYQKRVSNLNVSMCIAGGAASLFVFDLSSAAMIRQRPWPLLVLLADLALVCKLPQRASTFLVISGVVWLSITYTEAVFRFGLYDIVLTDPEDTPRVDCECSRPPCKRPLEDGVYSFLTAAFIFVTDFFITRGFAQKLYAQQAKMQRSIVAARDVSALLVQFQLAEAEALLLKCSRGDDGKNDGSEIPEEFLTVLTDLLSNLKKYEPFLPQSCFPYADDDEHILSEQEPSGIQSSVARRSVVSQHRNSTLTAHQDASCRPQSPKAGGEYIRRSVSIAAFNVRGLHYMLNSRALENDSKKDIPHVQEALLSLVVQSVSSAKGIVDFFMGDHVTCSWNASRPCISHRNMSVLAAYEIGVGLQKTGIVTHCGVSSGEALCGNVGTETLRRFNIVGHVYSLAHDITSVAKDWEIRLLIETTLAREVKNAYEVVAVPEMVTYCKGSMSFPLILWKIERANEGEEGAEWMYTVQSTKMVQVEFMNQLTVAHLQGQQHKMENLLAAQVTPQPPCVLELVAWLRSSYGVEKTTRLPLVAPRFHYGDNPSQ
ncbi:hypothetical protein DIPPA_00472 [Diplonema papillatum]|nr:hypothetical protein DIPPA_00472 [Diplonema papillatum]